MCALSEYWALWEGQKCNYQVINAERFGKGGISGKIAQMYTWPVLKQLIERNQEQGAIKVPVIGSNVWEFSDLVRLHDEIGVAAVAFGALFIKHHIFNPTLPNQQVALWRKQYGVF